MAQQGPTGPPQGPQFQTAAAPTQVGVPSAAAVSPMERRVRPQSLEDVHIDELLSIVVEKNASDLHLAVGVPPIIRLDGALVALNYERFTPQILQRMTYDILNDEQIQHFENQWELDMSWQMSSGAARFRVNVFRDRGNCAAAFRLIPTKIPTIRDLGLPPILEELARRPRGLLLVTGPTGCGKSTTLAAIINLINTEFSKHIITVEDPIEYLHTHKRSIINQRELGQDTKAFPAALRSALREDPDVILVGEMRDLDTMRIAITAAETGHLVLATLHTNSSAESVDRMVDVFPAEQQEQIRVMLSNNLVAILSQQLLPRAGVPGRVAIVEVMIATPAIRNLIRENKAHQMTSIVQTSANVGMQTMDQALRDAYQKGLITYEEAMNRCHNQEELKKMITTRPEGGPAGAGMPSR